MVLRLAGTVVVRLVYAWCLLNTKLKMLFSFNTAFSEPTFRIAREVH